MRVAEKAIGFVSRAIPVALLSFALAACGDSSQGEHGDGEEAPEPVSVTLFTEKLLLFMERPALIRGEPAKFLAHFSVLADGAPVRSGSLTLEAEGPDGKTLRFVAEKPARDGLFTPQAAFPEPGSYPARLILDSPQAKETLALAPLEVHASRKDAKAGEASPEPENAVPFLMEQQWKVGLLLHPTAKRTLVKRVSAPARLTLPEGAEAVVAAPLSGRLGAPEEKALPRSGERVEAGQILGYVEPPLGPSDLAQLQALRLEFDLKSLEIERSLAAAGARVRYAERELERTRRLREEGLRTKQQLDQAEQEAFVAKNEEESALAAKGALEALRGERGKAAAGPSLRLPLAAPIGGTVQAFGRSAGEQVDPEDALFRIVDTRTVWVDAQVSEFDLGELSAAEGGDLVLDGFPGAPISIGPGAMGKLVHTASTVDKGARTLLVRFEIPNPDGALRPGMSGVMHLATRIRKDAVAIPESAIVLERGVPTAYVMLEGELFQKRELALGIRDGGFVEVLRGLDPGERAATRGAYTVKLASLAPAAFGHGHAH